MMRARLSCRSRSSRGFTLLEALIVVLIIGLTVAIAGTQINNAWQKARIEAAAGDMRTFIQSAYTYMVNSRAPVFVRFVPDTSTPPKVTIEVRDNAGNAGRLFASYTAPDFVNFSATTSGGLDGCNWPTAVGVTWPTPSSTAPGILECDNLGRAFNPFPTPTTMVTGVQTLVLTHTSMISGTLTPKIVYTVQVFPLWQARITTALP